MAAMFYNCQKLTGLDLSSFNTGAVTDMTSMFNSCIRLEELNLSSFDTHEVTGMASMFNACNALRSLNLSSFDTHEVINMASMFANCHNIESLDLSSFDTHEVTNMNQMFYNCKDKLRNITFGPKFDTREVVDMGSMFSACYQLEALDLSTFDTKEVVTMASMFANCQKLEHLTLSKKFDTSIVTNMSSMFVNCYLLEEPDLSSFDTYRVTNMSSMFANCQTFRTLDLSNFRTDNVTTMANMFDGCVNLENLDISSFTTPELTSMYRMFFNCQKLQAVDLSRFDTRKVTNISQVFYDCRELKHLDLSNFETPMAIYMTNMFYNCYALEDLDISHFDTSNITDMSSMFYGCHSLKQLDLKNFNTYKVTTMAGMFQDCYELVNLDLSNFYTANVRNMYYMFCGCKKIETLDLSNFDTSGVTNMQYMFNTCNKLKTIYASNYWNIDRVTSDYRIFLDNNELVGGNGTAYHRNYTNKERALIDTEETPGYLTYKAASVNNANDLISTKQDYCTIVKLTDSVWIYTYTGLNPNVQYYAWEEEIDDYIESNLQDSMLEVVDLKGTITNRLEGYPDDEKEFGSLSIRKVLTAEKGAELTEADYQRMFVFTVTLKDENGDVLSGTSLFGGIVFNNGVAKLRIPAGATAKIDYIPSGYSYTVTEDDTEVFAENILNGSGVIETDITARVICTNVKSSVPEKFNSFTLRKIVNGIYETNPDYLFTVVLNGLHAEEEYSLSDGSVFTTNSRGSATVDITLKNGEEIIFRDLPVGSSYKITEASGDYVSSYFITDMQETDQVIQPAGGNTVSNLQLSTATEFVDEEEEAVVVFTNTRNARQNVKLVKRMQNASETNVDVFRFTATFSGLASEETIRTSLGVRTADENGDLTTEFELSANDEITFYKLPVGSTYQFTESGNEWIASYELTNAGTAGSIVSASDANELNYCELSTAVETVNENEEITAIFTNTKVQRDLTITKQVDMTGGDLPYAAYSVQPFKLKVSLSGLNYGEEYELQYSRRNYAGIERTDTITASDTGTAEVLLTLTHGQSVKIKNLPEGAVYTVSENPAINYVSSYQISGNEGAVIVRDHDANRKTYRELSTAEETVDSDELDVEVMFTNRYYDGPTARIYSIRIDKEIDTKVEAFGTPVFIFRLRNTDTGDDFIFDITLDGDQLVGSKSLLVTKGHYIVEELTVGRYSPNGVEYLSGTTASELKINGEDAAAEERKPDGTEFSFTLGLTDGEPDTAIMKFFNKLTNYSGVSHNSFVSNKVA